MGIFGPLQGQPEAKLEDDEDAEGEEDIEMEPTRKRAPQQLPNGSPAKRPRLSNGYEIGNGNGHDAATTTTPMDVDVENQPDNHAYPSPLEGEPAPPPIVHTDGPEQGTQVEKVRELAADTSFIRLMDDEDAHGRRPNTTPSPAPAGPDNAPIILQCEWNPQDPSVLAAAGTDALARVWTISRATPLEPGADHVSHHAHSLLDPDAPRDTTVTALAWTSDGSAIAVATDSRSRATVNVWSVDGAHLQTMEVSEPPVIKLSWNPSNSALLAISPDKDGALATVYYSSGRSSVAYLLPGHDIAATPLDAAWTTDTDFLLTGGDLFLSLHCEESSISVTKKFETKEDDSFMQVLYDSRSNLAATSSDKGTLEVRPGLGGGVQMKTGMLIKCSCGTIKERGEPSRLTREPLQPCNGSQFQQVNPCPTTND